MCAVAFGLNCFVQHGLGKQMNMFFVGPGNSPAVVFKTFKPQHKPCRGFFFC